MGWFEERRYRWKGQIYCVKCGATLMRVPYKKQKHQQQDRPYDPFTGQQGKIEENEKADVGLMVCSSPQMRSNDWDFWFSHQGSRYESGQHSMYYTDKAPL